jgi:hypothetical protein
MSWVPISLNDYGRRNVCDARLQVMPWQLTPAHSAQPGLRPFDQDQGERVETGI